MRLQICFAICKGFSWASLLFQYSSCGPVYCLVFGQYFLFLIVGQNWLKTCWFWEKAQLAFGRGAWTPRSSVRASCAQGFQHEASRPQVLLELWNVSVWRCEHTASLVGLHNIDLFNSQFSLQEAESWISVFVSAGESTMKSQDQYCLQKPNRSNKLGLL